MDEEEYSDEYPVGGMVDRYDIWKEEQLIYDEDEEYEDR